MAETYSDAIYDEPEALWAHNSGFIQSKKIDKPWGHETLLVATDKYVMKILQVNAGERLSVQYHEKKLETLYCLSGNGMALLGDKSDPDDLESKAFLPGMTLHITPGTVHTYKAITDLTLIECSTPEIHDVVRLQDRYGRS